jgi:hypothetical protein
MNSVLHKSLFMLFLLSMNTALLYGQSNNHWTRSFNEESSLLSGAVVGGGAGLSAIYFNPSSISEITESKLSFHMSLFSFNFMNVKNALGDGIDLNGSKVLIEPRFISFMIKPKNHPEWSLEIAFLNNENFYQDMIQSVDQETNVLANLPGEERYYALFQYLNRYRDDWYGFGGSLKLSPDLSVGASMFLTVRSLEYSYELDIEAYPLDSVFIEDEYLPFYSANYQELDYLKYNDYRLLWKFGLLYKRKRFSVGVCLTTPSIGGIYSDGKRVSKKQKQSNISSPESGQALPDYFIGDYQEKKAVEVNDKSPLSIAAGLTLYSKDNTKTLYTTVEYFAGLDPYRLAQADESPNLASNTVSEMIQLNEWLTFVSGAKPVFNAALGYRWVVKENIMLMTGIRTDFNYRKNYNYAPLLESKSIKGVQLDYYHLTGGISLRIWGQDLITGLQYTIGREKDQTQFVNLSDPVEYNYIEKAPLQGTRQNNMNSLLNSLSLYFGATFNFGGEK